MKYILHILNNMADYKNGKIYAIKSVSHPEDVYYGSTTQSIDERMCQHVSDATRENRFRTSALVIGHGDAYIELVEEYPCSNSKELEKCEGWYQKNNKCVNTQIAGRTDSEYREDNRERIREKWHENKEENNAKQRERHMKNRDADNERSNNYYYEHRDELLLRENERYANNKESILEKSRTKYAEDEEYRKKKIAGAKKRAETKADEISMYQKSYYEKNKEHLKKQQKAMRDQNKDKWNQARRDKAAAAKGMSIEDMIKCPNCYARFPSKSGLKRHEKKCEPPENHGPIDIVLDALKKFEIPYIKLSDMLIEVLFQPIAGIIALGDIHVSNDHPLLRIPYTDLENVETLIEDFIIEYDES